MKEDLALRCWALPVCAYAHVCVATVPRAGGPCRPADVHSSVGRGVRALHEAELHIFHGTASAFHVSMCVGAACQWQSCCMCGHGVAALAEQAPTVRFNTATPGCCVCDVVLTELGCERPRDFLHAA